MRIVLNRVSIASLIAAFALAGGSSAHAAVVASYGFDGFALTSSDTEPLTTASNIALPPNGNTGPVGNPSPAARVLSNNTPGTVVSDGNGGIADVTDPATGTQYFAFSVSQTVPLTTLSFTSLSFDTFLIGTGISERFQIRSDANGDNFQTLIPGVFQTLDPTSAPSSSLTIPLSSYAFLQNAPDATVNFRLYIADSRGTNAAGTYLDNINLSANVNVLNTTPEPAALGLLGVAAGGLLRRKRRA